MFFMRLSIRQQRTGISEIGETSKVSHMISPTRCLDRNSRWCQDGQHTRTLQTPRVEEMELRFLGDHDGRAEYWRGESCGERERAAERERENHWDLQRVFLMYSVEYLSAHAYVESNQGQGKNLLKGLEITVLGCHTGPGSYLFSTSQTRKLHNSQGIE